jgi:hypothetical protein
MARIVQSMGKGSCGRMIVLVDRLFKIANKFTRTGTQGHLKCTCIRLDGLSGS